MTMKKEENDTKFIILIHFGRKNEEDAFFSKRRFLKPKLKTHI